MEVGGDWLLVPFDTDADGEPLVAKTRNRIGTSTAQWKRRTGMEFVVRTMRDKGGVGVWRIK